MATLLTRMDNQDEKLEAIHTQTKLTNGRVNQHDKDLASLEKKVDSRWQYLVGGGAAISIIVTGLWAIFQHFAK